MVIALSHRYCCAAINHSLTRMLSSCCNKPAVVWNKMLLFCHQYSDIVSSCGWNINHSFDNAIMWQLCASDCVK